MTTVPFSVNISDRVANVSGDKVQTVSSSVSNSNNVIEHIDVNVVDY